MATGEDFGLSLPAFDTEALRREFSLPDRFAETAVDVRGSLAPEPPAPPEPEKPEDAAAEPAKATAP